MTEEPFVHKSAFYDVKTNFIFHKDVAKILMKLLNKKGIINVGGPTKSVYDFAKMFNPKVKKMSAQNKLPRNISMKLTKMNKIISK